jgi:hypothetical protein
MRDQSWEQIQARHGDPPSTRLDNTLGRSVGRGEGKPQPSTHASDIAEGLIGDMANRDNDRFHKPTLRSFAQMWEIMQHSITWQKREEIFNERQSMNKGGNNAKAAFKLYKHGPLESEHVRHEMRDQFETGTLMPYYECLLQLYTPLEARTKTAADFGLASFGGDGWDPVLGHLIEPDEQTNHLEAVLHRESLALE